MDEKIGNLTMGGFARRYAIPLWGWYAAGLIALSATNLIALEIPQLAKQIINRFAEGGYGDISGLSQVALWILLLGFAQMIIRSFSRLLIFWPGRKIEADSKIDLFTSVLSIEQRITDRLGLGDLVSRMANDIVHLRIFFAFGILQGANLVFISLFVLRQMYLTSPLLCLAALSPLSLVFIITFFAMPNLQKHTRTSQESLGNMTNHLAESLKAIHTLQALGVEKTFLQRAEQENQKILRANLKLVIIRNLIFPLMTFLASISQWLILLIGGHLALSGKITIGDILAFNVYIALLTFPFTALGIIISTYQRAKIALTRLEEVEQYPKEQSTLNSFIAENTAAPLKITGLTFSYEGGPPVLKNIHLDLPAGAMIGISGPVGSGKTTLFSLICRLYDPPAGAIILDGKDVLSYDLKALREQINYVQKDVHLFSSSVRENLAFGLDNVSTSQLEEAAERAAVLEDIRALPQGWETQIGEHGIKLSGGQRQRLALARHFLRNTTRLWILDDVLSAVDTKTEQKLITSLSRLRTTVLIASHRPSVLSVCSKVYTLEKGVMSEDRP